jgi:hypothetical protein
VRRYLFCFRVANGGKVWLVLCPGLKAGRSFKVCAVAFRAIFV